MRGDVPMACAFGGPIDRMKTVGKPLMTGAEQEAVGINTFDIISVTDSFASEHPDLVKKFLAVTEAANAAYKADPDAAYETIAGAAGMDARGDQGDDGELRLPDRRGAARAELAGRRRAARRPRASPTSWSAPATSTRRSTTTRPSSTRAS